MKVVLEQLTKKFDELVAVNNLNLEIKEGEIVSLLGPSGCGKTTTLNMIAGFEKPTDGALYFDGRNMNNVHPKIRNVGMVFQEYAIFTTMTAFENIAFGLRVRKTPKAEITEMVKKIAGSLNLTDTLHKNVNKLNLSELQRVALARTLSTQPSLLLLDEPLSNLDAGLREKTRVELNRFHSRWGITMVYVTHDQTEAISLASRIAVMNAGELQQFNTPEIIYKQPANLFVAQFIGNPPSNIIAGVIKESEGNYYFEAHGFRLDISGLGDVLNKVKRLDKAALGFRAEDIAVRMSQGNGEYTAGTVYNIELLGYESILDIKLGETIIRALVPQNFDATVGDTAFFNVAVEKVNLFDLKTGKNLLF